MFRSFPLTPAINVVVTATFLLMAVGQNVGPCPVHAHPPDPDRVPGAVAPMGATHDGHAGSHAEHSSGNTPAGPCTHCAWCHVTESGVRPAHAPVLLVAGHTTTTADLPAQAEVRRDRVPHLLPFPNPPPLPA